MTLSRSKLFAVLVVALAAAVVVLLWPKGSQASSEELIRQKVIKMARAAEKKDVSYIMEQISERFTFDEGGSKRDLHQLLVAELMRGNWLRVFAVDLAVTVTSPSTASFSGKFIFGRSNAATLKELAKESELSSYAIEAKLEKERDDWKFVSAKHRSIDPAEFL
ncbi:MAG TPA: hypothetical protein VKB87_10330 [Myxococcaceae bacterium]|nr:hypothetical protein [Myxococcaceae bacterium]